ncbi:MAG: hypothetical protein K2H89_08605 [Oscillospiraceae bacterium]|nr:hypothetical protein [Oscillospiraceae bacterium]
MYAMNVNSPFIVEDAENFFEECKKQEGIAQKISEMFGDEWFNFKPDENGLMSVTIDVQCNED